MIQVKNLTKCFHKNKKKAIDNISFTIKEGEIVALLGENGAGKTTTLRIIATLLKPTHGTCLINDHDILINSSKVRELLGFLLGGETGLYDRLTARENINYFAQLTKVPRSEHETRLKRICSLLQMEQYLDQRCNTFSRGMKQKTAIARSIIHQPPVLLLDEPTTGLDVSSSKAVQDFMLTYKNDNRCIIFSSHNIYEVKNIADRVIIMHEGQIMTAGPITQIENRYNKDLEEIFFDMTRQKR